MLIQDAEKRETVKREEWGTEGVGFAENGGCGTKRK
jgi:hypothetical protein